MLKIFSCMIMIFLQSTNMIIINTESIPTKMRQLTAANVEFARRTGQKATAADIAKEGLRLYGN